MARVAQAQGATDGFGEGDAEPACGPSAAVVTALVPEAPELDWSEPVRADQLLLDRHDLRKTRTTLYLLQEHIASESVW
jgi:hypothetical protein